MTSGRQTVNTKFMRIEPKPLGRYPWPIRLFFRKQQKTYGRILEPGLLWGRSPWVFSTVALLYGALNRKASPIPAQLRALVQVRVAQINHCSFCIDLNASLFLARGASLKKLRAVSHWQESALFDERDRTVLEYVEAVTHSGRRVSDDLMVRLKGYFDDDAVVELTGVIAFQNLSAKFNSALGIPAQGFCDVPKKED